MLSPSLRPLLDSDAATVAALHVDSWRTAYRGLLSDEYLANDIERERLAAWHARLPVELAGQAFGFVAEIDAVPVGFVYVQRDAHPDYGDLLDNLHVATRARSAGIGARLMSAAAAEVHVRGWGPRMHLWVFAANGGARRFYARLGGREVEHTVKQLADGGLAPTVRVAWDDFSRCARA
jgi:GNAT superfamily N-acetyltransferase